MTDPTREESGPINAAVTVNEQGWFLAVSAPFLELIGRPVTALAAINLVDLLHPLDADAARRMLAAATGEPSPQPIDARVLDADDRWRATRLVVAGTTAERITLHLIGTIGAIDAIPDNGSPEQPAAVAAVPDAIVSDRRRAIRAGLGSPATPMLEIDDAGRTVFVGGAWAALSTDGNTGADVFEELLDKSERAEAILQAIDEARDSGRASRHELGVAGVPARWVQVVPLPSPHRAGVVHALICVGPEPESGDAPTGDALSGGVR